MTIEEAIEILKYHYGEQFDIDIEALEKRLPKEVVFDRVYKRCSSCGETPMYFHYSYCPYCGQKLKWSKGQEEEEND